MEVKYVNCRECNTTYENEFLPLIVVDENNLVWLQCKCCGETINQEDLSILYEDE